MSLSLLVGAGLLLRGFAQMRNANIGVKPANVLTMRLNLPAAKYKTLPQMRGFFDGLLARVQEIPGVSAAAATSTLPLEGGSNGYIKVPGNTNPALEQQLVEMHAITPDYFKVFGIPLMEGRNFTAQDAEDVGNAMAKVDELEKAAKGGTPKFPQGLSLPVVINEAMAKTFWPNQDAVGKDFTDEGGGLLYKVIGVVGDVKEWGIREKAVPECYFPLTFWMREPGFYSSVVVKTAGPPTSVLNAVRTDVRALDSSLTLYHIRTMDEVIGDAMQDTSVQTFLLGVFAALALILPAVGLYGVMSYVVTHRTHEIGIRVALGAQPSDVLRIVVGQGMKLILAGVTIGIAAALALTRLMSAVLFGVTASDPLTYSVVAIVVVTVALAACCVPAVRAVRVDPIVALRYE